MLRGTLVAVRPTLHTGRAEAVAGHPTVSWVEKLSRGIDPHRVHRSTLPLSTHRRPAAPLHWEECPACHRGSRYCRRMASVEAVDGVPALGRLEAVDPRSVWAHEANGFTPWLLKNADVLGDALGMDLTLSAAEHPVGGFALDLIGVDEAANERVIIENQLEHTDHTHLGQLITYAGGTDAVNVVWVATSFREEHRAALDWLNARTDESTRFFGIEISAVRIGDSPPAPLFRVVVQPNDWGKKVKASARSEANANARTLAYQEFWTSLLDLVHRRGLSWTKSRKGYAQNWQALPAGMTGVAFNCTLGKSGLCSEIYFQDRDPAVNDARFAAAQEKRKEIEAAYGGRLSFEPLVGKKGCRIADYRPGDISQTDLWSEFLEWFVTSQTQLRKAIAAVGGFTGLTASAKVDNSGQLSLSEPT